MPDFCGIPHSRLICRKIRAAEKEIETFYVTTDEIKLIRQAINEYSSSLGHNDMLVMDISTHLDNVCKDMLDEYKSGQWKNHLELPLYLLPSEFEVVMDILQFKKQIAQELQDLLKDLDNRLGIIQSTSKVPFRSEQWDKLYAAFNQRMDGITFGQRTLPREEVMYRKIELGFPYSSEKREMYEAMYHCDNIYKDKEDQEICKFICDSIADSLLYEGEDYVFVHIFETQYMIDVLKSMMDSLQNEIGFYKLQHTRILLEKFTPIPLNFKGKESKEYEKFMKLDPTKKLKKIKALWKAPVHYSSVI